jgi:hypothetical protein
MASRIEPARPRLTSDTTREAGIARNMAVCHALGIPPERTTSLRIELGPDGSMTAHWDGILFLDDDQRAAVAKIIGGE